MATRIISAVIGFPIFASFIILGGIYLKIGILFASLVGMFEFYRAINTKIKPINYIGFLMAIFYISFLGTSNFKDFIILGLLVTISALMIYMVLNHEKTNISDISITLFGFFYIAFMFSNVYLIRYSRYGVYNVWLPFICAWGCDTGAYFVGLKFGKHKLTPILSPKKTIEGAIGGILVAGVLSVIYISMLNKISPSIFEESLYMQIVYFLIGIFGAVFAQFGDLFASSIKRKTGIKDYGKLIPGHGGILDRFDSAIFTTAIIYLLSAFLFADK